MENIITVTVGTAFDRRQSDPIPASTTPRQLLDQYQVPYGSGQTNFCGHIRDNDTLDKPFSWFADQFENVASATAYQLLNIPKQDNA